MSADIASPEKAYERITKFTHCMLKSGMTMDEIQRVIDKPALRAKLLDVIRADMTPTWVPASTEFELSRVEERLSMFDELLRYNLRQDDITGDDIINVAVSLTSGKVTREQVLRELFLSEVLRLGAGMTVEGDVSFAKIATYYRIGEHTAFNRYCRARRDLVADTFPKLHTHPALWMSEHFGVSVEAPLGDLNVPLEALSLSPRTRMILHTHNVMTADDLAGKTEQELLAMTGITAFDIFDFEQVLSDFGQRLQSSGDGQEN